MRNDTLDEWRQDNFVHLFQTGQLSFNIVFLFPSSKVERGKRRGRHAYLCALDLHQKVNSTIFSPLFFFTPVITRAGVNTADF